jgi:hypothetical protein
MDSFFVCPRACFMNCCCFFSPAARERIIGWYHTGPRLREADLDIHQLLSNYCDNPILVISEVQVRMPM